LYYNSEIWFSTYTNNNVKHKIFVASANALKIYLHYQNLLTSFLHPCKITGRSTPMMITEYKFALQLFKVFNECTPIDEGAYLNLDQVNISRQTAFQINRNCTTKIGRNSLCNRFHQLNGKIPLTWLENII
jgi:hypothetical protein